MSIFNPHLYSCESPYYCWVPKEGIISQSDTHSGSDMHAWCLEQCMELFHSIIHKDFWILLAENNVVLKTDVETEFYTKDYTILELIIMSENIAMVKSYRWDWVDRAIYQQSTSAAYSRLSGLSPTLCAVECLSFIKEELVFDSVPKEPTNV